MITKENKIVLGILAFFLVLTIILYVVYSPLRTALGIYGFLILVSLTIYSNSAFQNSLIGVPKKFGIAILGIFIGAIIGIAFVVLPKFIPGLSMGLPMVPAAVEDSLRWIITCGFAPSVEDITRFSILGVILFLFRKKGISKGELWLAITLQAVFFTVLHATAYASGWYEAPNFAEAIKILGAVNGSLVAAFLFAMVTGWAVTRNKKLSANNILISIAAHYTVNQILFVKMSVVFSFVAQSILGLIT